MDNLKKTPGYAETQIRVLLADLKNSSHQTRVKGITKFQEYIQKFKPEIYDDDVDFLFTGLIDGNSKNGPGLLHYCGLNSGKHSGQLKRICAPAISLIRWLISFQDFIGENIFYERFIVLTLDDYKKINFEKHILNQNGKELQFKSNADKIRSKTTTRDGSGEDAFILLKVILNDHRNSDSGEAEPIPLSSLIQEKACLDKLDQLFKKFSANEVTKTIQQQSKRPKTSMKNNRPKVWSDIVFKPVPIQEGETTRIEVKDEKEELDIVPDPLGIYTSIDLKHVQSVYEQGLIKLTSMNEIIQVKQPSALRDSSNNLKVAENDLNSHEQEGNIDKSEDKKSHIKDSVNPRDPNFSFGLFLRLVHTNSTLDDLYNGLTNLDAKLDIQSNQREGLVRSNYGLFVQCSEGLAWLKDFRKGILRPMDDDDYNPKNRTKNASILSSLNNNFEARLQQAQVALDSAKLEADKALIPILDKMKYRKKIITTEKVIHRFSLILTYPYLMHQAISHEDYIEAIRIYNKIQNIPSNISLLTVLRQVKEISGNIIQILQEGCLEALKQNSSDVLMIKKYSQILSMILNTESYRNHLRNCYLEKLQYVSNCVKAIYVDFIDFLRAIDMKSQLVSNTSYSIENLKKIRELFNFTSIDSSQSNSLFTSKQDSEFVLEEEFSTLLSYDSTLTSDHSNGNPSQDNFTQHTYDGYNGRFIFIYKLLNLLQTWVPCLQLLASEISTPSNKVPNTFIQTIDSNAKGKNVKSKDNPTKSLCGLISSLSHILNCLIRGQLSYENVSCFMELVDASLSGNKINRDKSLIVKSEAEVANALLLPCHSGELPEACHYLIVQDIIQVHDSLEAILSIQIQSNPPEADRLYTSNMFYEPMTILRDLSHEGEISITQRIMNRLSAFIVQKFASMHPSKSLSDQYIISHLPLQQLSSYQLGYFEAHTLSFLKLLKSGLYKLKVMIKRPQWVRSIVLLGFQRAIQAYLEILRRENSLINEKYRIPTLMESLETQEKLLLHLSDLQSLYKTSMASSTHDQDMMITYDLIRSVIYIRSSMIPWLFDQINTNFPNMFSNSLNSQTNSTSDSMNPTLVPSSNSNAFLNLLFESPMKSSSNSSLSAISSNLSLPLVDKIKLIYKRKNIPSDILPLLEEVALLEDQLLQIIISINSFDMKRMIYQCYGVLIRQEMKISSMTSLDNESSLPRHLSDMLLDLSFMKQHLDVVFYKISIENGIDSNQDNTTNSNTNTNTTKSNSIVSQERIVRSNSFVQLLKENAKTKGEAYGDYIYHRLCLNLVDIYQDLIHQLESNSFHQKLDHNNNLGNNDSMKLYPIALGRAQVEIEYLKAILQQLLPAEGQLASKYITNDNKMQTIRNYPSFERLQDNDTGAI